MGPTRCTLKDCECGIPVGTRVRMGMASLAQWHKRQVKAAAAALKSNIAVPVLKKKKV